MDKLGRGIIAGFLATIVLSAVLDPVAMLVRSFGLLSPSLGWLLHFLIGTLVWGAGFALVHDALRGPSWFRGVVFGAGAWLAVIVTVTLMRGVGIFVADLGISTPAAMLGVHVVFGAILGVIYDLVGPDPVDHRKSDNAGEPNHANDNDWHPVPR